MKRKEERRRREGGGDIKSEKKSRRYILVVFILHASLHVTLVSFLPPKVLIMWVSDTITKMKDEGLRRIYIICINKRYKEMEKRERLTNH